ncbi:MAG: HAD-IC family P-type ATPase, partial [Fimbriimonadaceae bacterium]
MDRRIHTVLTSLCGVSLAVAIFGGPVWASWLAVAFGSVHALEEGWDSLRRKEFDVHILMLLAAAGSIFVGHPTEAAVLLFLFALAGTLEEFAMARTKSAIEGLIKLRPDEAIRIDAHGETRVPVGEIVVGDLVRVPAFQGVPLDGEIVEGVTQADESAMTGEARPVDKREGDRLLAGTQNLEGTVTIRVTAASGATMLEKVVALVNDAQENKASGERISQWFGQRYTFFVLGAALLSWGIRLAVGQAPPAALFASLTLLVALSPCALVISTPATTLSALAW